MTYEEETGLFQIAVNINGNWWKDEMVYLWMKEQKYNYHKKYNTRKQYARALDIFFHYYIYLPHKKNESLYQYLLLFREALLNGIHIKAERSIKTERSFFVKEYSVLKVEPSSSSTADAYTNAVEYYLQFLKKNRVDEKIDTLLTDEIDWNKLKKRSIYGKGGGYGLLMSPLVARLLGPKKRLIKNLRRHRNSNKLDSYFPPELFNELLEISNPREQAIYLLCAFAGTRIGQALSLTRDDYNTESREVFIIDPLSSEMGPSGKILRAKLLKDTYNIDMEKVPYKNIACKYPIPSQYSELFWIHNSYRDIFFKALSQLDKGNPITNGHPFIFNTSSGKILTPNESYRIYLRKIKKLQKINGEKKEKNYLLGQEWNVITITNI